MIIRTGRDGMSGSKVIQAGTDLTELSRQLEVVAGFVVEFFLADGTTVSGIVVQSRTYKVLVHVWDSRSRPTAQPKLIDLREVEAVLIP
jgi:hypothetical protein